MMNDSISSHFMRVKRFVNVYGGQVTFRDSIGEDFEEKIWKNLPEDERDTIETAIVNFFNSVSDYKFTCGVVDDSFHAFGELAERFIDDGQKYLVFIKERSPIRMCDDSILLPKHEAFSAKISVGSSESYRWNTSCCG